MQYLESLSSVIVDIVWGPFLIVLLVGGGVFLFIRSGMLPVRRIGSSLRLLTSRSLSSGETGAIHPLKALATALSATVGMGNISGVAVAITMGGPGALFWMWVTALAGMATKFFTCSLSVMYRKTDQAGNTLAGPMYVIELGLSRWFRPLAYMFAVAGLIGCLPLFQINQLAQTLSEIGSIDPWVTGVVSALFVFAIIQGGIRWIGTAAGIIVPVMSGVYLVSVLIILSMHLDKVPFLFAQIFQHAFTGRSALGGATGMALSTVISNGVKRAAFSNEAGIGTAPMAHGQARNASPIREGLIAMLGPLIDTILVCSATGLAILATGAFTHNMEGISITLMAFETALGPAGRTLLAVIIVMFAVSTMLGYSHYSKMCFLYLTGNRAASLHMVLFVLLIVGGAVWSMGLVINTLDIAFGLMAVPTVISTLLLHREVLQKAKEYFRNESPRT
ncbi:MAG: sodium:alanine symporter family protein [Chlorobi bacterium]|nr:sodium:alanine symporter family protein [Chlorobiota bacterium]